MFNKHSIINLFPNTMETDANESYTFLDDSSAWELDDNTVVLVNSEPSHYDTCAGSIIAT